MKRKQKGSALVNIVGSIAVVLVLGAAIFWAVGSGGIKLGPIALEARNPAAQSVIPPESKAGSTVADNTSPAPDPTAPPAPAATTPPAPGASATTPPVASGSNVEQVLMAGPAQIAPGPRSAAYSQTPSRLKLGAKEKPAACWKANMFKLVDGKRVPSKVLELTHFRAGNVFYAFKEGVDPCFTHQQVFEDVGQCPQYTAFVEPSDRVAGKGRMLKQEGHVQCYSGTLPTTQRPTA